MNLRKLIVVALSAIVALSGTALYPEIARAQPGNNRRTFADWCRQKADLSSETKHTVEVLLEKAETTECDAADRKLSSLTELILSGNQIGDIKPLASLTKLNYLFLNSNQISDIKPLASLTNLTRLNLNNNKIKDIKPLASLGFSHNSCGVGILAAVNRLFGICLLTNLTVLDLHNNQISDIKPLASLTNLTDLNLNNNQIKDIKPLASLTKLSALYLSRNSSAPKTCPLKPESICNW